MTVEYVDAGEAINQGELSGKTAGGEIAPPVVENLTYERILDARSEPHNWMTYYGAYDGQRFSPLDQINTENVKRIGPAWIFQAGTSGIIAGTSTYSFEAAPIIVDGVMFLSGWDGWVWALDAKSGGEIGVRGHLDAFDIDTGEHIWRCYMVPKPGEPGSETWPADGEAWARGGANCWLTSTFDPETNLLYVGTGNPAPDFDGEVREGDNLYTDSIVAVDVDEGRIRWHYQCTPHDVWDYDSIAECILFESDGRKLLGHFDKNGYFFVLDRTDGSLVQITPFVDRIDWGNITRDGKVTRSRYPEKEGEPVHFYPGPAGSKEWTHAAYSPRTELFYVPVQDVGATATRRRREFKESIPYWGAGVQVDIEDMQGSISAFDAG